MTEVSVELYFDGGPTLEENLEVRITGPAAMVLPGRQWPYRFLREKNGIAWILTSVCVME